VDHALEFPVVADELMVCGIGERCRYWIAWPPDLNLLVIAGEAKEVDAGAGIGGIPVRAIILQITL